MNVTERILIIQSEAFFSKLKLLNNLYGLRCEIFFPLPNLSHYQNSSKFTYAVNPDETRQILITNSFEQLQQGTNIYDPFNPVNPEAIVEVNSKLKDNCKIRVYKGSSFVEYRSDINSTMVTGHSQRPLYIRHKLISVI